LGDTENIYITSLGGGAFSLVGDDEEPPLPHLRIVSSKEILGSSSLGGLDDIYEKKGASSNELD